MKMEQTPGNQNQPKETTGMNRKDVMQEVYKRYHQKLIGWCRHKLAGSSLNPESDAEEIVSNVYEKFLKPENLLIDLTKSDHTIESFLGTALDYAIKNYLREKRTKGRIPESKLISVDEMTDKDWFLPFKEYLSKKQHIVGIEDTRKVEQLKKAMTELKTINPRMVEVLEKTYVDEQTQEEIATFYHVSIPNIRRIRVTALSHLRALINFPDGSYFWRKPQKK